MNRENKILIVTGCPEQFTAVAFLFQNAGHKTVFASDVRSGLNIAGDHAPVLIISELAMPDIDSFELCRGVRSDKRSTTTPVVIVGDLSPSSAIVADSIRSGASEYFQKPIGQLRLFEYCSNLLRTNLYDISNPLRKPAFNSVSDVRWPSDRSPGPNTRG